MVSTASTTPISTNNNTPKRGKINNNNNTNRKNLDRFLSQKDIVKVNSIVSDLHSNITSSICRSGKSSCRNSTSTTNSNHNNINHNNRNNNDDDLTFKDFDYDEQIRFPRVNTYYTYNTKRLLLVLMMINQAPNHIPVVNQFSNILQRNNKIKIKQIKVKKVMNNMNMIIYRQILI